MAAIGVESGSLKVGPRTAVLTFQGLSLAELQDEEVLFFIRIRGKKSYFRSVYPKALLDQFCRLREFRTISEYRYDANVYIDLNRFDPRETSEREKSIIAQCVDEADVIQRCRGLRNIDEVDARNLIISCARFFIDCFSGSQLKLIVSGAVDNYVMDLMVRIAKQFGIKVMGVTQSFLHPHYHLVTIRGEHNHLREPSDHEIATIVDRLESGARSAMVTRRYPAIFNAFYTAASFYYRCVVRYLIGYRLLGNRAFEYRFAPWFRGLYVPSQLWAARLLNDGSALENLDPPSSVYIPLHCVPEATVDYWMEDSANADYLSVVLRVAKHYSDRGFSVVLKEHPAFYLCRTEAFYRRLLEIPRVTILSPFVLTNDVFAKVSLVVVWSGSTGVEALVRGLNVRVVGENYYSAGSIPNYLQPETEQVKVTPRDVIKRVLQTSLPAS